jgi:hypothetical protein
MSYAPCLAANTTATAITAKVATITKPVTTATAAIIDPKRPSGGISLFARQILRLMPFGTAAANLTGLVTVLGWQKNNDGLWIPTPICLLTCTFSAAVGVAAHIPANTDFLCDAIVVSKGSGYVPSVTADVEPAIAEVPVDGYELIEVGFGRNGSSASVNALYDLLFSGGAMPT